MNLIVGKDARKADVKIVLFYLYVLRLLINSLENRSKYEERYLKGT